MSKITVKAKPAGGFRRAGIKFTRDGVELDTGKLSEEQLDAIANEPNLVVVGEIESKQAKKEREASEKAAAGKAAADKAAAEKAAADKAAAEKAAAGKGKGAK